jgi:hypothetical protein
LFGFLKKKQNSFFLSRKEKSRNLLFFVNI